MIGSILPVLVLSGILAITMAAGDFVAPWYYHGLDGPIFTNTTVDNNVQTRNYEAALWASTVVLGTNLNDANEIAFNRLFAYISGANDQSVTIDMTTPVINYIQPPAGPNCNTTFTVSFYVPYKYQTPEGPPKPTAADVFIQQLQPLYLAVTEYDGFGQQKEDLARAAALESQIEGSKDVAVDENVNGAFFYAGYDPPFRLSNRHNEMWVPVVKK